MSIFTSSIIHYFETQCFIHVTIIIRCYLELNRKIYIFSQTIGVTLSCSKNIKQITRSEINETMA